MTTSRRPRRHTLRGLRLAVPVTLALDAMDKHVADTFARTLARLAEAGALIDEIEVPEFAELGAINSKGGFTAAEAWAWHRDLIARAGKRYDPRVVSRILRGKDMSAADYLDLLDAREAWVAGVDQRIAGYDALILPTTPIVAPAVADLASSDEAYYAANGLILRNPADQLPGWLRPVAAVPGARHGAGGPDDRRRQRRRPPHPGHRPVGRGSAGRSLIANHGAGLGRAPCRR